MNTSIQRLITVACTSMRRSRDPFHELDHAERVAKFAERFGRELHLQEQQIEALILAAWWHDVGRTVTKKPSMLWMPFFDDIISAFMLWGSMIRNGITDGSAGMATRIIFCKSLGTGAILTRVLMRRRNRVLVNIIKDADAMDVLTQERILKLLPLVESSRVYHFGYKTLLQWFVKGSHLHMKTEVARAYVEDMLRAFLTWVKEQEMLNWHIEQFGQIWVDEMLAKAEALLTDIMHLNQLGAV